MKQELNLTSEEALDAKYLRMALDAEMIALFIIELSSRLQKQDVPFAIKEHFLDQLADRGLSYILEP